MAAQLLAGTFMGIRRSFSASPGRRSCRNVNDLKTLYVQLCKQIRTQQGSQRADTGARDGPSAFLKLLCQIPGKETYVALRELEMNHPQAEHRSWMRELAYKRAVEDADLEPWSAKQVWDYDQHQAMTLSTHRQLFDLTVDCLNDLKAWVEHGNDSPYKTWRRVHEEIEMRNLVAGWLNERSSGRYTCAQESEFPNRQKPDILMQSPLVDSPVPIELKLLDIRLSGPKLCERLRNQLAGDYLREAKAGYGIFLLVWHGRSTRRGWQVNGKRVTLSDLPAALLGHWKTVSGTFPSVNDIHVILIDLTIRDARSRS